MKNSKEKLERIVEEYKHNYPRFKKELKRLLNEGVDSDDIFLVGAVSYYLALIDFNQGHRTSFLSNSFKAATMLEKTSDHNMIARSLNLLGIAYVAQENYQLALDAYNKSLQTIREHRSCRLKRDTVLSNIAECYFQMGEYMRSIRITSDCLKMARKKTPEAHESITIYGLNLSEYYEAAGDYEKAEEILDSISADADLIRPGTVLSAYHARRAVTAYISGDPEKGTRYSDLLLEAVDSGCDTYEIHTDFEKIAHEQLAIGDLARAKRFSDVLRDYARSSGHTLDRIIAMRTDAEYSMAAGDRDAALELYSSLNGLYKKRLAEEKAMQFTIQKKVEETKKGIRKLMQKVRISEENAKKDPLTQLLNRSALANKAAEFVDRAKAKGCMLGGVFIDIDYFKEYNDTYGHARGDEVIKKVADACLGEESSTVRFARYGGDEFFGLVLGAKDGEIAAIAARICAKLREDHTEHINNPCGSRVTVSVGVVNIDMTDSGNTIIDVINCADKALYHAKSAGKDAVFVFDGSGKGDPVYRKLDY